MLFFYGLGLEAIAVNAGFYSYGSFRLELFKVPIVIALGWAVIAFSAMRFSDHLNLPEWSKPFLDALFALSIDLGMDVVAIRDSYQLPGFDQGMWNWGIGLNSEWFGVPYANFIVWWAVVFIASASLRLGRYYSQWFQKKWLSQLYPLFAFLLAMLSFIILFFSFAGSLGLSFLLLLLALSVIVGLVNARGFSKPLSWQTDLPVFIVPLAFHSYFLCLLLGRNLYTKTLIILLISLIGFALNLLVLHLGTKKGRPNTVL